MTGKRWRHRRESLLGIEPPSIGSGADSAIGGSLRRWVGSNWLCRGPRVSVMRFTTVSPHPNAGLQESRVSLHHAFTSAHVSISRQPFPPLTCSQYPNGIWHLLASPQTGYQRDLRGKLTQHAYREHQRSCQDFDLPTHRRFDQKKVSK